MQVAQKRVPTYTILHVSAGCWATGAGLSEMVALLALAQARAGERVAVAFLDDHPEHPALQRCRAAGVAVFPIHRISRDPFYFSINWMRRLPKLVAASAQIILHGAWTFPLYWAARCAQRAKIPYGVFPHGSFDPVRRAYGKARKAVMWHLFNRSLLERAAWLHAASEREARWMQEALGAACPLIKHLPLGVDGEVLDAVPAQSRTPTFLYLGRQHPLKGLDLLLQAWRQAALPKPWTLQLAGPHIAKEDLPPGVSVLGELQGEAKVKALKSATCLVLPTRSENFGIVVAEALWCHTPVICTKGAPWAELGDFWVEISADALAEAIRRMAALSEPEREAAFNPLFAMARERFAWTNLD